MSEYRAFVGHTPSNPATIARIFNFQQSPAALLLVVPTM
jgi:hypothetical protein